MGWNINLSGAVSREVRGLPDDYNGPTKKGWLYNNNAQTVQNFTTSANDDLSACNDEQTDYAFLDNLDYNSDTEPDVFYFYAPGLSGKFVFGSDGLPKLIPYQDLLVTYSASSIEIKTNTGLTYTFNQIESTTRKSEVKELNGVVNDFLANYKLYEEEIAFTSSWKLGSISSSISGKSITFNYQNGLAEQRSNYVTLIPQNSAGQPTTQVDTLFYLYDEIQVKEVNNISLATFSINVEWANALISKISILESESNDSKEFVFNYSSVTHVETSAHETSRPFLKSVSQVSACTVLPDYAFTYAGSTLNAIPWHTQWGQDIFGYYNGEDANKNIPTVYFYENNSGANRFRLVPPTGGSPTPTLTLTGVDASNNKRLVNANYSNYGAVETIQYPTGGFTRFTYEPNTHYDASVNEEFLGPGVRVASITSSGGEAAYARPELDQSIPTWHSIKRTFQYQQAGSSISSGFIMYPPVYAFVTDGEDVLRSQSDLGPGSEVLYARVTEFVEEKGSRVYEFDIPNHYPDSNPNAPSSLVARLTGNCYTGYLKNGLYTLPYSPLQDLDYTRGHLKKLSEYDQSGNLTVQRRLSYSIVTNNPGAGSVKGLKYNSFLNSSSVPVYHYSPYTIAYNQSKVLTSEIDKSIGEESQADSIKMVTAYEYNNRNMLTHSTQTTADGAVAENFIKYAMDFTVSMADPSDPQAVAISSLNTNFRQAEIIERYQQFTPPGGSTAVTGATLNLFKKYENGNVLPFQVKSFPQGLGFTPAYSFFNVGTLYYTFIPDPEYIGGSVMEYDQNLPTNSINQGLISSGAHYASSSGIPLARFSNCKAENASYEGFEFENKWGLTWSGQTWTTAEGRTGQHSLVYDPNSTLNNVFDLTKSENTYRVSCWVKATQNANVTIQAKDATTTVSAVLAYNTPNQWQYLEDFIDVSSLTSTFRFHILTSATIQLDDFIGLPKSATVSASTLLPFKGVTSSTDNNGNSSVTNYDNMGRKTTTLDHQRNLVELLEYKYQKESNPVLKPNFNVSVEQIFSDDQVVFTAVDNCIPSTTYQWTITDDQGAQSIYSGSILNKTFARFGPHTVKLTVSSPGYDTQSFSQDYCVNPGNNYYLNINVSPNTTIYSCDVNDDRSRTFTASIQGAAHTSYTIHYNWQTSDNGGNDWVNILQNDSPIYTHSWTDHSYQVRCVVSIEESSYSNNSSTCPYLMVLVEEIASINFVDQGQCQ